MATDEILQSQPDAVAAESKPSWWYDESAIKKFQLTKRVTTAATPKKIYVPVPKPVDWRETNWRTVREFEGDESFLALRQEALSRDTLNADQKQRIAAAKNSAAVEAILAEKV